MRLEKKGDVLQLLSEFRKAASMEEVEFDQGAWGLATRRPTSATTNYNLDCLKRQHQAEEETEDPTTTEWPPTLKHALAIAVGRERF